jgi:hypothetical protein
LVLTRKQEKECQKVKRKKDIFEIVFVIRKFLIS